MTTGRRGPRLQRINRGSNHWYKLDGDYAIGVTTALGDGLPKPALVNWAAKTAATYAADHREWLTQAGTREEIIELVSTAHTRDRDQAANKGTIVHRYAEQLARDGRADLDEAHGFLQPHVEAYARFLDDADIDTVALECPMANTAHRYCGTGDLFARSKPISSLLGLPDDALLYVDLKTNRSGVFAEAGLQCLAYTRCDLWQPDGPASEQPMPDILGAVVVHVTPDGCTVHPVDISSARHWTLFRAVLHVAYARRKKDGWIDQVLQPELNLTPAETPAA